MKKLIDKLSNLVGVKIIRNQTYAQYKKEKESMTSTEQANAISNAIRRDMRRMIEQDLEK